jgi:hypothetical protein
MNGFTENDWARIEQDALTSIRCKWSIERLEKLARTGNPTPVSGDALHRP